MTRARLTYGITMVFLYLATVMTVLALFFPRMHVHNERVSLGSLIEGTAHIPYAYRVLVPAIVGGVTDASGAALARLGVPVWTTPVAKLGGRVLTEIGAADLVARFAFAYGVFLLLCAVCFLGTCLLLRALVRLLYPAYPRFVSDLAPVLAIAVLPVLFFRHRNLVYDPMTLLLSSLCLYLIARRSHALYLAAFLLAALNKETAILLAAVFVIREWGAMTRRRLGLLVGCQVAMFVAVKLLVTQAMRGRPGSPVEYHLDYNLALLGDPTFYVKTLLSIVPLVVLAGHRWRAKPAFLRHSLVAVGVPLLALTLFMGVFGELRALYEIYPLVTLLAIPTAVEVFAMAPASS